MPTYEYVCDKCGHQFEKVQSMTDPALQRCPKDVCPQKRWGRGQVKRVISAGGGLLFKGSGFYSTDYRSENYKAGAKKESEAASPKPAPATPAASATPPKSDSKPAAEKPSKPKPAAT